MKLEDNRVFRDTLSEHRVELEADAIAFFRSQSPVEDLKGELTSMGGLGDSLLGRLLYLLEPLRNDGSAGIPKREQLFVAAE